MTNVSGAAVDRAEIGTKQPVESSARTKYVTRDGGVRGANLCAFSKRRESVFRQTSSAIHRTRIRIEPKERMLHPCQLPLQRL